MSDQVNFPTWQEILDEILSFLPPEWRANFTGKIFQRLLVAYSLSIEALYGLLAKVLRLAIVSTSEGQWLRSLVSGWGMNPYGGIAAVTILEFTRSAASQALLIPAGTEVATGSNRIFRTDAVATLTPGQTSIYVPATSTIPGATGNVAPHTLTALKTAIAGIDNVTNPSPATGGEDPESDASIRSRVPTHLALLHRATIPATEGAINSRPDLYPGVIDFMTERQAGIPGYFRGKVTEASQGALYRLISWTPAVGLSGVYVATVNLSEVNGLVEVGWPCRRYGEISRSADGQEIWSPSTNLSDTEQGNYRWFFDASSRRLYARAGGESFNGKEMVILSGLLWRIYEDLRQNWVAAGIHFDIIV